MIDKTRKMYIGWQHLKCIAYVKKEQYSLYFHLRNELVCMEENGEVFAPESGVRPCDDLYQALYDLICG